MPPRAGLGRGDSAMARAFGQPFGQEHGVRGAALATGHRHAAPSGAKESGLEGRMGWAKVRG